MTKKTITTKTETFLQAFLKKNLPDIRPGDTVRVFQRIPAVVKTTGVKKGKSPVEGKEKLQMFEGLVLAKKHGKEAGATITVRKVVSGVGTEMIFPIHSPNIEKIELVRRGKVRRAKLYYLREAKGRKAKLKRKEIGELLVSEKTEEKVEKNKETLEVAEE